MKRKTRTDGLALWIRVRFTFALIAMLCFAGGAGAQGTTCPAPTDLACTAYTAKTATLSWTENGSATAWQICLNDDETNLVNANSNPFTLTGLTTETVHTAKVRAVSNEESSSWSHEVSFVPTSKWVIGSGTATSTNLPTNNHYGYSLTQQIYTADEMGAPGNIVSIDFYSAKATTRSLAIYMVGTAKSSFDSRTSWVKVNDDNQVFSGSVEFKKDTWTTIELNNSFNYDGHTNIVIVVDDNTGNDMGTTLNFKAFEATAQSIHIFGDDTDYNPNNPPKSGSYTYFDLENVKNQIRLGKDLVTSITLSPTAATMVVGGGTLTLEATVEPENATDKSVTWTSNDENVATVIDGVVTAVAAGTATITATANDGSGKVGTCTVTVNPPTYITLTDGTDYTVTSAMAVTSATYTKTLDTERVNRHQPWLVPFDYTITDTDLAKFDFFKINMIANSPSPSVEASDDMWVFLTKLSAEAVLHANMPYVYKAKEAVTNYAFTTSPATMKAKNTDILLDTRTTEDIYSFYATYENTTASSSYPFYYVAIDGTICLGNDDNLTVGPYRWIIRKASKFGETPSYARNMHFYDGEGEATAIREDLFAAPSDEAEREVNNGKATNTQWFTLDGRKLNAMPTQGGVYIVRSAAGRLQGKNGKIIVK